MTLSVDGAPPTITDPSNLSTSTTKQNDDKSLSQPIKHCAFCQATPASLLACGACQSVKYCNREHQKQDWKRHKLECKKPNQTNSSSSPSTTAPVKPKTIADIKEELEAKMKAASLEEANKQSVDQPSAQPDLDITKQPVWAQYLWSKIQYLYQQADSCLENPQTVNQAIKLLTQALHLHAALPESFPRSVLKNLYGYRSVAWLTLPENQTNNPVVTQPSKSNKSPKSNPTNDQLANQKFLSHLAVYDAITALKSDRDYIHAYGIIHNAWKAFGNLQKAKQAAENGQKVADARGLPALSSRFGAMVTAIDHTLSQQPAKSTEPTTVEARNSRTVKEASNPHQLAFQQSVERKIAGASLYHFPSRQSIEQFSYIFPPSFASDKTVTEGSGQSINQLSAEEKAYWATFTDGKGFEVAMNSTIGRHLVATREFKAGATILIELPLFKQSYVEDVCANCWKTLQKDDDGNLIPHAVVLCSAKCGHEKYCSNGCRDAHAEQHEPLCGHSWRELRERASETVTTSGNIWLVVAAMIGACMKEAYKHEKEIRGQAIKGALTQSKIESESDPARVWSSSSASEALNSPCALLSHIPSLSHLESHYDLSPSFNASIHHDFDQIWAMSTMLSHWFITTPTTQEPVTTKPGSPSSTLEPNPYSQAATSLLPYIDYACIEQLYSRCLLNSVSLHSTPYSKMPGKRCFIAIGRFASLMTHSCFPCVSLQSDGQVAGGKLMFTANHLIKKGDVLTISYIGDAESHSRLARAHSLLPYGFLCQCSKCKREKLTDKQWKELVDLAKEHGLPDPQTNRT